MNCANLDLLDSVVAKIEGPVIAMVNSTCVAKRLDQSPYRPTRDPHEALRLMDKYIGRVVKMNGGWAAVGPNGRACIGPTLSIAVCIAIIEGL